MPLRLAIALLLLSIGACSGQIRLLDEVDTGGGVTHIKPREPLTFVAKQPGYAVPGADYVFVAPVAVSRRGRLKHYLWLGARSTIDRRLIGVPVPNVTSIVVIADEQPIRLDLEPWENASQAPAFSPGLIVTDTLAARVTTSQLRWLAKASTVSIVLVDAAGRETRFDANQDTQAVFGAFNSSP
ncbi:MAG: hypothetical protein AAGC71_02615 [Pseudomonadota bacterium]